MVEFIFTGILDIDCIDGVLALVPEGGIGVGVIGRVDGEIIPNSSAFLLQIKSSTCHSNIRDVCHLIYVASALALTGENL